MTEINYEIVERIAILSERTGGWTKELNKVSWNKRAPKYEIRDWNHEKGMVGKGTTMTAEELANLREVLNAIKI